MSGPPDIVDLDDGVNWSRWNLTAPNKFNFTCHAGTNCCLKTRACIETKCKMSNDKWNQHSSRTVCVSLSLLGCFYLFIYLLVILCKNPWSCMLFAPEVELLPTWMQLKTCPLQQLFWSSGMKYHTLTFGSVLYRCLTWLRDCSALVDRWLLSFKACNIVRLWKMIIVMFSLCHTYL